MIEVKDHEKFLKDGMIFGNYGPGNDDVVHLVLLEAAERLVATLRRRYRPRA